MTKISINHNLKKYKFEQLRDEIIRNIENGNLRKGAPIKSMKALAEIYGVSMVTVNRSFMHLKEKGYVTYLTGKGYYISDPHEEKRILLVFNRLNDFKRNIYDGFLKALGAYGKVDLKIHHYDIKELEEILTNYGAKYDYYVVMPHFKYETSKKDILNVLNIIPPSQLILLDKQLQDIESVIGAVYQDFELDIYGALNVVVEKFSKYKRLKLVLPSEDYHPMEIINGAKKFCVEHKIDFRVIQNVTHERLIQGLAFIVIDEVELGKLIKRIRNTSLKLGKDIGIISFNETILKELLDITVFSTDFFNMGFQAGKMIAQGDFKRVRNPFNVLSRKSF